MTRHILFMAMLLGGMVSFAHAEEPAPAFTSISESELEKRLDAKVEANFKETPLSEVVTWLDRAQHVPARLDVKALADASVDAETPVTIQSKGISLRSVLELVLRPTDLTLVPSSGALLITTKDVASNMLVTRTYDVVDLIAQRKGDGKLTYHAESLLDLMTSVVAPSTWDDVGGPGNIHVYDGIMVVTQTPHAHRGVENLLTGLRKVRAAQPSNTPVRMCCTDATALEQALAKKITWQTENTSLENLVATIFKAAEIEQFQFDRKAMNDASIDPEQEIGPRELGLESLQKDGKVTLKDLSLAESLRMALNPSDLTYCVDNDYLLITTKEVATSNLYTAFYPIEDLDARVGIAELEHASRETGSFCQRGVNHNSERVKHNLENSSLIALIQGTLAPTTWDDVGGPGSMHEYSALKVLVVSQTADVHQQIEALLAKMRADFAERAKNPPSISNAEPDELATTGFAVTVLPGEKLETAKIVSLIKEEIATESWERKGTNLEFFGNRLIVKNTSKVCKNVYDFLVRLGYIDSTKTPFLSTSGGMGGGVGGGSGSPGQNTGMF